MYLSSLLPCLTAVVRHAVLCWERKPFLNADSTVKHAVAKDTGERFSKCLKYSSLILPASDNFFALKRLVLVFLLVFTAHVQGVCEMMMMLFFLFSEGLFTWFVSLLQCISLCAVVQLFDLRMNSGADCIAEGLWSLGGKNKTEYWILEMAYATAWIHGERN